jgi:hypothetical protein
VKVFNQTIGLAGLIMLVACSDEPPPISVGEFMEDPRMLEATMVRCAQNRSGTRYKAECVNAREAGILLEAALERNRREEMEKQSERKRQALRQTQETLAKARRRADEERRRREEAEYLGIFDERLAESSVTTPGRDIYQSPNNAPTAIIEVPPATSDFPSDSGAVGKDTEGHQQAPE